MAYSVVPTVSTSDSWTASQHNTYLKDNMAYLKAAIDAMGTTLFPIGSIIETKTSTNPSTYLGGTWTAHGPGRVTVAIDAGQTEFDTVDKTGGAKTHTLSTSEIPSHTHNITNFPVWSSTAPFSGSSEYTIGSTTTKASEAAGSGGSHNNLQPHIVVYRWVRTA